MSAIEVRPESDAGLTRTGRAVDEFVAKDEEILGREGGDSPLGFRAIELNGVRLVALYKYAWLASLEAIDSAVADNSQLSAYVAMSMQRAKGLLDSRTLPLWAKDALADPGALSDGNRG